MTNDPTPSQGAVALAEAEKLSKACAFAAVEHAKAAISCALRVTPETVAAVESTMADVLAAIDCLASLASAPPVPTAIRDAMESLRHVDREIWDDITSALESAKEDHCNAELDELDCALLLDLLWLYRNGAPTAALRDNRPLSADQRAALYTLASATPAAQPDDIERAVEALTRAAWNWGESCGVDGVRFDERGDSHNDWMRADAMKAKDAVYALLGATPAVPSPGP